MGVYMYNNIILNTCQSCRNAKIRNDGTNMHVCTHTYYVHTCIPPGSQKLSPVGVGGIFLFWTTKLTYNI